MVETLVILAVVIITIAIVAYIIFLQYKKILRENKNYERGLKMIPLLIHLPPSTEDIERGGRDERDINDEEISKAEVMYNIISSTVQKGFKSKIYGQRHISFEIIANDGIISYYVTVPFVMIDVIRQAVSVAYPSAMLEEVKNNSFFNANSSITGIVGGEFILNKEYYYPIATFQESKRDSARALLNSLSSANREDSIGIQFLMRPTDDSWHKKAQSYAKNIKEKGSNRKNSILSIKDIGAALWKPPTQDDKQEQGSMIKELSSSEQKEIEAIEEKLRHSGYETLIRVVVSTNLASKSQAILKNVISSFSLFNSPTGNGFKFSNAKDINELVTAFIFRFFPQKLNKNILNNIELATIFHLPSQDNIPSSKVQRQASKQVDGPTELMNEGVLLGYNEYRGVKKQIRLTTNDRRRHTYIIGQTGTGKSVLLENIAYQDMLDGRGFAFVDPHGDSIEALLGKVPKERVDDIIYFNPSDMDYPIGLNMFEFDHPDQKDFLIQEAINMLYGLYDPGHTGIVGPRLEHIFRNSALLLMSDPAGGTFIDIPKLLIDDEFMKSKLKYVRDQTVLDFWTKEFPESKRSNEAGEVISWVISKFGPFLSNDAMRNIIGQTKSGFNLREIMDNKKILLVNLSKGKMGEFNSKLLGIIFIMKFQAAAMSRANVPENEREDFCLFVDEFQNFATDSFESILSEARKYRLNLILGNQFMTQLTEKIREAIIGNVGTVISGRIGITDAEILVKKFAPVFDAEDLTKLPNHQSITSIMINNVPSAPFSMSWIPAMGDMNIKLAEALKGLSKTKFGKPRADVERAIFERLGKANIEKNLKAEPSGGRLNNNNISSIDSKQPTFLDQWLTKKQQIVNSNSKKINFSPQEHESAPSKDSTNNNENKLSDDYGHMNIKNSDDQKDVKFNIR